MKKRLIKLLVVMSLVIFSVTGFIKPVEAANPLRVYFESRPENVYEGDVYSMRVGVSGVPAGDTVTYKWQAVYDYLGDKHHVNLDDNDVYSGTKTNTFGVQTSLGDADLEDWEDRVFGYCEFRCEVTTSSGLKAYSEGYSIPRPLAKTPVSMFLLAGLTAPAIGHELDYTVASVAPGAYTTGQVLWYKNGTDTMENLMAADELATSGEYCVRVYIKMVSPYKVDTTRVCYAGLHNADDKFLYDKARNQYYVLAYYTAKNPASVGKIDNKTVVEGTEAKLSATVSDADKIVWQYSVTRLVGGVQRKLWIDIDSDVAADFKASGITIKGYNSKDLSIVSNDPTRILVRCKVTGAAEVSATSNSVVVSFVEANGWVTVDLGTYYYENGEACTGWKLIDDKWYYFGTNGVMQKGSQKIDGDYYRFDEDGAMIVGWYDLGYGSYSYYTKTGRRAVGWVKVDGKWYYFNESGSTISGLWKLDGEIYLLNDDGSMYTGWYRSGDNWYYYKTTGAMATGWTIDNGKWYYMNESGVMQTGWLLDGGKWYYLKSSGEMAVGWAMVNGRWYYFNKSGEMYVGWLLDGGKWYYLNTTGEMATGWALVSGTWYYMDANGVMVSNTTMRIGGKNYTFSSSGACINP